MHSFDIGMIFFFISPVDGLPGTYLAGPKPTTPDRSLERAQLVAQTLLRAFRVVSETETKADDKT